jgi:hypothetical protein
MSVFRRAWAYAQKRFNLGGMVDAIRERPDNLPCRRKPRIPTERTLNALFVMGLLRLGSLHGLAQNRSGCGWRRLIGGDLPSARTNGRVMESLDCDGLRLALRQV